MTAHAATSTTPAGRDHPVDGTPLCVDLDGSLVNTDTLLESALLLARKNPLYVFAMLFWLLRGKASLKEQIVSRTTLDVATLPYNAPFIEWLRQQRHGGRNLVLVTAGNHRIAEAIGAHLAIFSKVLGSTTHNLGGAAKRRALEREYGAGGYDYAGNSCDDLAVWSGCRRAVLVNASPGTAAEALRRASVEATFPRRQNTLRTLASAMRPHQWSKNLLVFVSILIAHEYTDTQLLLSTTLAFFAFCLCASSVYLVNDLLDLESDRRHPEKRNRPFASGRAPLILGMLAAPVLLAAAAVLAWIAGGLFLNVLLLYFAVTLGYSLYLKRMALLDILTLAMLYTLRIVAGASVADAMPSVWLVSFSMFFFTSLAMAKRYAELKSLDLDAGAGVGSRGYQASDASIIAQLGAASGYISTLVLALYIDSDDVAEIYHHQHIMWILCPLLMYWIGRIWLVASRGELHHDPVVFATRDRNSYVVLGLGLLTLVAAL